MLMIIGRFFGWMFLAITIVMLSGDVVMALGSESYHGLATADLWTFLWGTNPINIIGKVNTQTNELINVILKMPAWAFLGPISIFLLYIFRPKRTIQRTLIIN